MTNGNEKKILVVDDQYFNVDALRVMLSSKAKIDFNRNASSAFNGREALWRIVDNVRQNNGQSCSYQLILMDCNMPFIDGYEGTDRIREFLSLCNLPQPVVVAVTGHAEDDQQKKCL